MGIRQPDRLTPDGLRARRTRLGLSLDRLAEALSVDRMTVWRWEKGDRPMPGMLELALRTLEREAA